MSKKNKSQRLPGETPSETRKEAEKVQNPAALATPSSLAAKEAPKAEDKPAPPPHKPSSVRLSYVDPGKERGLPAPLGRKFRGGEKVKLSKSQTYADGVTVPAGEVGFLVNPSSQAACWCVRFPKLGAKTRVVPEWELEPTEPARAGH